MNTLSYLNWVTHLLFASLPPQCLCECKSHFKNAQSSLHAALKRRQWAIRLLSGFFPLPDSGIGVLDGRPDQ